MVHKYTPLVKRNNIFFKGVPANGFTLSHYSRGGGDDEEKKKTPS